MFAQPKQNPNYIKKKPQYYLQYRSKWKCKKSNITPILVSVSYYSLRFPFLILTIDQNLTDINIFFHQNTEMKSSSSYVLVNFKDFGNFVHVYLLQWWILSYFPPDSRRGGVLDHANDHLYPYIKFSDRSIFQFFLNDENGHFE